ncbi:MAG: HAMP domain-containing histidine kinase [Polaromonas sp.]|nr:HAMP domain-containing histidine kinase [Polaromonas sp.]
MQTDSPLRLEHRRQQWVQQKLIEAFVGSARLTLTWSLVVIGVLFALLYPHVDRRALWIWTAAILLVILARQWSVARYQNESIGSAQSRLESFVSRSVWLWPLSGVVWGGLTLVFLPQAPPYKQFVCMTVLLAMPGVAAATFSAHWRAFAGYADGLLAAVVVSVFLGSRDLPMIATELNFYGLAVLAIAFWAAGRAAGQRMHAIQRDNLELHFDNEVLVASLTEKTRAALDAVGVKNRFIAGAAHDLRQPVHALGLYASWLAAEPALVADIAPKIVRSTRAVDALFNSLFEFTALESDNFKPTLQSTDLLALLQDIEIQYAPVALERALRLRTRLLPMRARSDPVLLKRLVGNLVSNALKNTPHGGVLLACRERRGRCWIEVWDTGIGIAEEHRQEIFQEFYRVPRLGTEEGFGLGLAIVARLGELLGHRVSVASRVGRGSVFRIDITPAEQRAITAPKTPAKTSVKASVKASPAAAPDGRPETGS